MELNVFQTYYTGILKRLRSEVDILNQLIPHNSTKGTANEDSLKNILKNFIPKNYGIGSGIIIDSFGNMSRQVDLIIYDDYLYPTLFGQTNSPVFFPVETVIAAIEIKTYLDKASLYQAFNNSLSVKNLRHYTDKITINKPSEEFPINLIEFNTLPPSTHLFAYRVDTGDLNTWKDRYYNYENISVIPDTSLLLDIASCFHFSNPEERTKENLENGFFPLRITDVGQEGPSHNFIHCTNSEEVVLINGNQYKSAKFMKDGHYPILMPERAFLSFILRLNNILEKWPRHHSFNPTKYLDPDFGKFHNLG